MADVLATWIKGIQIGVHEIKTVNFAYESTIFLRDFSCLNIIELSQKCSNLKIIFSKSQTLWDVAYKNRIEKPKQMACSQFSTKMVGVHFHNSPYDNRNWDKNMKT